MAGSTISLEPLSSPSPSPPPPVAPKRRRFSSGSVDADSDSGSELSELTEEEQEENSKAEVRNSSRPRDSKRKRSNLLPPPMWDWAYKTNKKSEKGDWRTRLVEEEEEEEQSGPAKAMEEEEDDEHERGDDVEPVAPQEIESDGEDERDDDDDEPPAHASDAEALEPPADDQLENEDATDDEDIDEDDGEPDVAVSAPTSRAASQKGGVVGSPELTDDENAEDEEEAGDDPAEDDPPLAESDADDEAGVPVVAEPATPLDTAPLVLGDDASPMDIDPIIPPPPLAAPIPHTAAASSIMAGSSVVVPPSRSPSTSSSASGSPSSSRSPTPEAEADVPSDREPEPEREVKGSRASRRRKPRARTRKSKAAAGRAQEVDGDVDQTLAVGDGDVIDEEADMDSPELEFELESDLQPAHRAEALEVLATIELKFALLRERLYVEKMDDLAWEEALVAEGTHPELLHLNDELSKRRDKRLELASRRRDFEVLNVTKRRKLDEDGVWSWWKADRDDLQTEMISETNRKRRKLDRERRALERPQPERRIPGPRQEIRAPPTLREIVKSYPFGIVSSGNALRSTDMTGPLTYPRLTPLPGDDIRRDLEFLFQHRRGVGGFDPHRQMVNPALGAPVPQQYDYPMNIPMVNGPGPGNRFVPGPGFQHPHYPEMQPPLGMQPFQPQAQRPAHHPSAVPGSLPNLHPSQAIDQDMGPHRPGSGPSQPHMHMQQFGGMAAMNGPGGLMRARSISPVPVQTVPNRMAPSPAPPGFSQSKPNGWVSGGPPGPSMLGPGGKEPRRPGSGPSVHEAELERERFVEGQKAREKMERERDVGREREQERGYPVQMIPPRHQHTHPHVHAPLGQPPHVHVVQHHHRIPHHHHVVHHHHPPQTNGPGGPAQGPPMSALPAGMGPGPSSMNSPRPPREVEPRHIHPSASMEDMAAGPSRQLLPSPLDTPRDRVRPIGPAPSGPHDRLMTPFAMGPSQGMQSSYPGSPHNALPPPTAPPSVGGSRRGSFTANEEPSLPRPASSASTGRPSHSQNSGHRLSISRRPQTPPPPQSRPSAWGSPTHGSGRPMDYAPRSPPRTNGGHAPHMSPSGMGSGFPGPMHSPTRTGQPPAGMQLPPPPSLSSSARSPPQGAEGTNVLKNGSPTSKPFGRPPSPGAPLKTLPGSARSIGLPNPETVGMGGLRTSPTGPLFSPSSQTSSNQPLPPPRIPNGSIPDMHPSAGPIAPKVVPVDGS